MQIDAPEVVFTGGITMTMLAINDRICFSRFPVAIAGK